jgi:hypothetical protein
MGQVIADINDCTITKSIFECHILKECRNGLQHRLEDTIFDTFINHSNVINVHWGAFESGKSRAARNAAIRLQETGKLVILLQGHDFTLQPNFYAWLQASFKIPNDNADEKLSMFSTITNKETVLIIDQFDIILHHYSEVECIEALRQIGLPVLLLVSSWERALELTKQEGCNLLGEPGFGRWTEDELMSLFKTYNCKNKDTHTVQVATLAGSPGILFEESFGEKGTMQPLAKIIDAEWHNGIRALNGEDMQGITGRFPDKDGYFHRH